MPHIHKGSYCLRKHSDCILIQRAASSYANSIYPSSRFRDSTVSSSLFIVQTLSGSRGQAGIVLKTTPHTLATWYAPVTVLREMFTTVLVDIFKTSGCVTQLFVKVWRSLPNRVFVVTFYFIQTLNTITHGIVCSKLKYGILQYFIFMLCKVKVGGVNSYGFTF